MVSRSAPGKVILFGEHAVVYGRPAIAAPVRQVQATACVQVAPPGSGLTLIALDLEQSVRLEESDLNNPLAAIAFHTLAHLGADQPDAILTVTSTIPIASGLGSGAAVSTAIARALAAFEGCELAPDETRRLVYQTEKLLHGTPSGIDNTVIAYERPVYFVRDRIAQMFDPGAPLYLVIAGSGVSSSTRAVVADVRARWKREPDRTERLFDRIGALAFAALQALADGDMAEVGRLMDENHDLLRQLDVSCDALDRLVASARSAGALGAKLSGAGRGGNVIALVEPEQIDAVAAALASTGAQQVIVTHLGITNGANCSEYHESHHRLYDQ